MLRLTLIIFTIFVSIDVSAQCMARRWGTVGPPIPVYESPGASLHWAHTYFIPQNGQGVIIYGPTYFQLPPIMQQFTKIHECCHLSIPTTNEFVANCCALRRGNFTNPEVNYIAQFHNNIGLLPQQYGGSGANFWSQTMAICQ